jgi:hypothetical protein
VDVIQKSPIFAARSMEKTSVLMRFVARQPLTHSESALLLLHRRTDDRLCAEHDEQLRFRSVGLTLLTGQLALAAHLTGQEDFFSEFFLPASRTEPGNLSCESTLPIASRRHWMCATVNYTSAAEAQS